MTEPLDYDPLIEVTLPAPVDVVWDHLRDPAKIRRWFGWEYEGLDDEIAFIFQGPPEDSPIELPPDAGLDVDDAARTITWRYGGEQVDHLRLTAEGDGTRLRMTRTVPPEAWDGVFDDLAEGWRIFVQQLRFAFTHHPGEERRTVWIASPVTGPGAGDVTATLGLGDLGGPGAAWRGAVGPDTGCSGTVWHRLPGQVGVVVDQWGPGLLVATWPRDTAGVTLATYGLADTEVDDLAARWRSWWGGHLGPLDGDLV